MKRLPPYDVAIAISKMAVFNAARKRERKALLDFFDRLAAEPFQESDWTIDAPPAEPTIALSLAVTS